MIYGPINREYSRLSNEDFLQLLQKVDKQNGRIILLDADPHVILQRIQTRGDNDSKNISIEKITNICNSYKQLLLKVTQCKTSIIDNSNLTVEETLLKMQPMQNLLQCAIYDFNNTVSCKSKILSK